MKLSVAFIGAAALFQQSLACPGHEDHVHDRSFKRAAPPRPTSTPVIAAPTRPLVWSDVNVIHSTDTHGWLLGHQKATLPEPNYSGTFGDFASFVSHMQQIALEKDVDLILVDSGDLHDGTGLSDGFPPGQVDAQESNQFIKQLPYDLLTVGNHELSDGYDTALNMYTDFAPFWRGKYLTSNVNITVFNKHHEAVSVPLGSRFRKWKTRKGRRVTSLGVLFDFTGNAENTTVQKVEDMVKEQWFAEAIRDEPDMFLLVGHMPVSEDNWPTVHSAIRAVHAETPILIFGGHSHIRDCQQYDGRTMALESGRYMETIGWMSVFLDKENEEAKKNLTFTRRYLDQNRLTYEFHTGQSSRTFDTAHGLSITKGLNQLSDSFNLSFEFGTAPNDFFLTRAPFPSNESVLSLFIGEAAPVALAINNNRSNIPNIICSNSGELRFDIFQGVFDRNDQFTALPFADAFLFLPDVPLSIASQVNATLNAPRSSSDAKRAVEAREGWLREELYKRGNVDMVYRDWLKRMIERDENAKAPPPKELTLGYVTTDGCPGVGDDVPHQALPFFDSPDFICSTPPNLPGNSSIDLVFINFIESDIFDAFAKIPGANFSKSSVKSYSPFLANQLLGLFAQEKWNS